MKKYEGKPFQKLHPVGATVQRKVSHKDTQLRYIPVSTKEPRDISSSSIITHSAGIPSPDFLYFYFSPFFFCFGKRLYSPDSMAKAIEAVRSKSMGYKKACKQFGVPKTTLMRLCKEKYGNPETDSKLKSQIWTSNSFT